MVESEPDCRLLGIRPFHPMAPVGRDQNPVPGAERPRLRLVREPKARAAGEEYYPLLGGLVVPLPGGGDMTGRHDPLQPETIALQQRLEGLR